MPEVSELIDGAVLRLLNLVERFDRRGRVNEVAARDESAPLASGSVVGDRYRLEAVLGEGGMGRVWLAEDTLERRRVALKEMRLQALRGAGEAEGADVAFKREFYTMAKLQHPGTVKVFDYGLFGRGDRFIAMELVRGRDLADLLKRGPLELPRVYKVLIDAANVLGFIHSRLYVHCDIKAENLRVTDRGALKLMDFGLMHQLGTPAGGALKGTVHYMAPEIPRGGVIDGRTDLYSLGVLAFQLATARLPFSGRSLTEIISQHLDKPPPKMRPLREVPEEFERIVAKLLAKDPRERYADSAELLRDLGKLSGRPIEVEDYGARASYLHSAELIGRDAEQQKLKDALAQVREGKGRSLFVGAPAGVGKTRLLQEFRLAVKLAELPFFTGQCRAEGQAANAPLVEALTPLVPLIPQETLDKYGPGLVRLVPALATRGVVAPPPKDPGAEKVATFEALRGVLRETAAKRPFILCLEDLHWADASTLELMNVAVRELAGKPAMLLGTFRSNEVDRLSLVYQTVDESVSDHLELPPLSPADTTTLLSTMLRGFQPPAAFGETLFERTRGNAFFVTEALRTLIEQGGLSLENGQWRAKADVALPASIEDAVAARLASLPKETFALCTRLAPAGRLLDLRLVKAVAELSDEALFARLDELVERQFLQRIERDFYFTHDTVRQGITKAMPEADRKSAHQRIGEALEVLHARDLDAQAALLGYHFARGTDRKRAIGYLRKAGDQTLSRGVMLEGARLLAEAADLSEAEGESQTALLGTWARLVEVGAMAHPPTCVRFGDKLLPVLEKRAGPDAFSKFEAETRRLVENPGLTGRRRLTRLWSEQPLDPASDDPLHLAPRIWVYRNAEAFACGAMGQGPKAQELIGRLLGDSPQPGAFRAVGQISRTVGLLHMGMWGVLQKEVREVIEWFDEHLRTVGDMPHRFHWNHASAFYWLYNAQALMGERPDESLFERGMALCAKYGFSDWRLTLTVGKLNRAAVIGDAPAMQKVYAEISEVIRRLGNPRLLESRAFLMVPVFYLQRGERTLAEGALKKVEDFARILNDAWSRRYALVMRAQLAAEFGTREELQAASEAAMAAATEVPSFSRLAQALSTRARVELNRGEREAAKATAEEAVKRASTGPTAAPWDEILALRTLADVATGPEALAALDRADATAERCGHTLQQGHIALQRAKLTLASDRTAAAKSADAAEQIFTSLGCNDLLVRVQDFRRKAGGG